MCVIMIVEKNRVPAETVRAAFEKNGDGGGAAWRVKKSGEVHWKKGCDLSEMVEMARELPLPHILHFRIASIGPKIPQLTHPFPISDTSTTALAGRTKGQVLFHNGTWNDWHKISLETAVKFGKRIPSGKWSDTRAMAWCVNSYGPGFVEFLNEKAVIFGPSDSESDMDIFSNTQQWKDVGGVLMSNDWFLPFKPAHGYHSYAQVCRYGTCRVKDDLDENGYCDEHSVKLKQVEEAQVKVREVGQKHLGDMSAEEYIETLPMIQRESVEAGKKAAAEETGAEGLGGALGDRDPFILIRQAELLVEQNKLSNNKFKHLRRRLMAEYGARIRQETESAKKTVLH